MSLPGLCSLRRVLAWWAPCMSRNRRAHHYSTLLTRRPGPHLPEAYSKLLPTTTRSHLTQHSRRAGAQQHCRGPTFLLGNGPAGLHCPGSVSWLWRQCQVQVSPTGKFPNPENQGGATNHTQIRVQNKRSSSASFHALLPDGSRTLA